LHPFINLNKMKYYLLPENFPVRALHKTRNSKSKSYFGYKDLVQVKFVENSSIHNEHLAVDYKDELLNKNNNIACSLELKKTIQDSVPAKLLSGKVNSTKALYVITNPGKRDGATYGAIKIKNILNPKNISSYDMNEFRNYNAETINYLQEQVDNFILDSEDCIVLPLSNMKPYGMAGNFWSNNKEQAFNYFNKTIILFYQKPIHYKNVMDINTNNSSFTEERFDKLKQWCSNSLDPEQYKIVLNVIAGFNLLNAKDVLMTLLFKNYLFVFRQKLIRAKLFPGSSDISLFNYQYYTNVNSLISQHSTIDALLKDYETIIRTRTSNFKVSPEDMETISKYFYIPLLDRSAHFEIKISPKFVNYT
jgi:hypothetical protein